MSDTHDLDLAAASVNDLAEQALHGLDVARRQVRDRPMLSLAVAGFLVSSVVVVAGGRVGAARSTRALTSWLRLENSHRADSRDAVPAAVLLAGVVALVLLWLLTVEIVRRTRQSDTRVWYVVAAWAAPLAVGPPLMDTGVFTYAAYGLLQRDGHDPYDRGPSALGDHPVVAAIDPGSRGVPSSTGPLGSLLQHLSVSISGGSALGAVIVFRVVGILTAIAIGRLAADMGGSRRGAAVAMCVLNPLTLLYVISSPHLDGVMIAFAIAAMAAANQRRWVVAVALACVSGSVSAQGFVLVPIIVTIHCLGRRTMSLWRLVGRDLGVAVIVIGAAGLLQQPDGFGWLRTVSKQFSSHTPYAIASVIGQVLEPIVPGASYDDLAASGRITAMTAAACTIVYLLVTAGQRALERTVGYALLALGLLAPSLYPWYVLWGALCLAPTALGERRVWVLALCSAACVLMPSGFSERTGEVITGIALAIAALVVAAVLLRDHRRSTAAATLSAEG